jgi:hypothetical protein
MTAAAYQTPKAVRWLAGIIATISWFALASQLDLLLTKAAEMRISTGAALVGYFSFLSIETNLLCAIVTSLAAVRPTFPFAGNRIWSALAVYLVTGGIIFAVTLRHVWAHNDLQVLANVLLHYVTPILYAAFWLMAAPKDHLRWRDPAIWLIYPFIYLVVVLLFGLKTGFYPYPLINLKILSAAKLAANLAALAASFLAVGMLIVAIGRLRFDRRNRAA